MPQAIIQSPSPSIIGRSSQRHYKVQTYQIPVRNVPESSPCHASEQSLLPFPSSLSTLRNPKFLPFPVISQNRTTLQFRPPSSPLHRCPFQFRYIPPAASPHLWYCRLFCRSMSPSSYSPPSITKDPANQQTQHHHCDGFSEADLRAGGERG